MAARDIGSALPDVVRRQGAAGGVVVGAASIINRGGGADLGVPYVGLASVSFPTFPADQIPPELRDVPAVKPGSRMPR